MHRAISWPLIGASKIPLRKWPVDTQTFRHPGRGPIIGRPSGDAGRKPDHDLLRVAAAKLGISSMLLRCSRRKTSIVVRLRKPTSSTEAPTKV
jgi:hypothetical protein